LAKVYEQVASARAGVAAVHEVQSLNPAALEAHLDLYKAVVFGRSQLSRRTRERIAVAVSAQNQCGYCVAHHAEALRRLGESEASLLSLSAGNDPEVTTTAERALLRWVRDLTAQPPRSSEGAIETLRRLGLSDSAILDATLTAAYFCFVNRLVVGLGVKLEPDYAEMCGALDDSSAAHVDSTDPLVGDVTLGGFGEEDQSG
jgi:uncharacterized peroxidase-related enzyme